MTAVNVALFKLERSAAKAAVGDADIAAKAEEVSATTREADRKSRLATALASQVAESGAKGVSAFEGSPLTILQADIKAEETATQRDIFQSRLSALTTRAKGRIQSRQIKTGANIGLIQSTLKTAEKGASAAGGGG